ncbi:MAG: Deoxyhypusine synthase [Gemmatimonadetes bacterium]|nr:Deoxyhypusine synthase [Gemmatimonadota bacterium]
MSKIPRLQPGGTAAQRRERQATTGATSSAEAAPTPTGPDASARVGAMRAFVDRYFERYNAGTTKRAALAYVDHLENGGAVWLSMAGAMSTAAIGRSVAELIRQDKVHAIVCTGANLEEDLFLLCGAKRYVDLSDYRDMTPADDEKLREEGINRVTDTGFPDTEVIEPVVDAIEALWKAADRAGEAKFPHEYLYEVLKSGALKARYEAPSEDSWLLAAAEKSLPMFVPGWEDSTLGNAFVAATMRGDIDDVSIVRSGLEGFRFFAEWYATTSTEGGKERPMGMVQIGGGIAGDAPICAVPMLRLELKRDDVPLLAFFCQITDATESYGGYSGAPPTEKISWGKLDTDTKYFDIHSDATIVFPLMAAIVLGL